MAPFTTNHTPTPEDSHAILAARAEQRAKEAEAKLAQSLEDNQSLLLALGAEQQKNEQLAALIEQQSAEISRLKRDNTWYQGQHTKHLKAISEVKTILNEYPRYVAGELPSPSDIIEDFERGIAAVGKEFVKHFGKVAPF